MIHFLNHQMLWSAFFSCFAVTVGVAQDSDTIRQLVTKLESSDVNQRRDAARALSRVGVQAESAVDALAKALADEDRQVSSQAMSALTQLGPLAEAAVPVLVDVLKSEHIQVRYRARHALGKVGATATPALIEALRSETPWQRVEAAKSLGLIGYEARTAVDDLLELLNDSNEEIRDAAAFALGKIGEPSVGPILAKFPTEDTNIKRGALLAFELIGSDAVAAIPAIMEFVDDDDPFVRMRAARALAYVGIEPNELVRILGKMLADTNEEVHHIASELFLLVRPRETTIGQLTQLVHADDKETTLRAAHLLGRFGKLAQSAVPELVRATVRLGKRDTRGVLPEALGAIGSSAVHGIVAGLQERALSDFVFRRFVQALKMTDPQAFPLLLDALKNHSPQVRSAAALALGARGRAADIVLPQFIALLADEDAWVRARVIEAVGKLGEAASSETPALVDALSDVDPRVRTAAIIALGKTVTDFVTHATLFTQALGDEHFRVRLAAASVIGEHSDLASVSVDALVTAACDQDEQVRATAILGIAAAGQAGEAGESVLMECLKDSCAAVRANAAKALGEIGEANPKRVIALGATLADESTEVRRQAVLALRELGPISLPAVPQLIQSLEHEDSDFRILVVEAFRPIISNLDELMKPLLMASKDSDREVRRTAAYELGEIGPAAKSAVPRLFEMIENDMDRYAARTAVAKITPRDIPLLIEKMKSEHPFVRRTACDVINDLGVDALPALNFLKERLADKQLKEKASRGGDYGVRRCIEEAVKKMTKMETEQTELKH